MLEDDKQLLSKFIREYENKSSPSAHELVISSVSYASKLRPNLRDDNPLTMMEMLCLIFMVAGEGKKSCAKLLSKSEHTIKTYEQRIRDKLMVKNRANAFYSALSKGYISVVL